MPRGSFEDNLKEEVNRGIDEEVFKKINVNIDKKGFIWKGVYFEALKKLYEYYNKDQVLILISERMEKNIQGTYNEIFDFLWVKRENIDFERNPEKINKRQYKSTMSKWAEKTLYKIYKPYNEKLFELLGYRVDEWDQPY